MNHSITMKTIAVLSVVLILTAALSLSASAAQGDTTYQVTVESGSDVYTPENPLITVNAGGTVTLSIPDDLPSTLPDEILGEYAVTFSCWRFTGKYEMVQGTVNENDESLDKTVVVRPLSDLKAVACFEEDNAYFYMVDVDTNSDAYKPLIEQGECIKGENWTFSVPKDLEGFVRWEFSGEYEVIQGTVDENGISADRTVELKPLGGIEAFARFEESADDSAKEDDQTATADQVTPDQNKANNAKTSPKTGDLLFVIAGILLIAAGTGTYAIKRIRE